MYPNARYLEQHPQETSDCVLFVPITNSVFLMLKNVEVTTKRQPEYCKTGLDIDKSIKIADWEIWCKSMSVVIDNESKINKLRQLLLKERIIVYGCGVHWMNLLAQRIIPISITKLIVWW